MREIQKICILFAFVCFAAMQPLGSVLSEEDGSTKLFESPEACVQRFNFCLQSGDFEGLLETFAPDVQAKCLDNDQILMDELYMSETGEWMERKRLNTDRLIDWDYKVINQALIESRIARQIISLVKMTLIPAEWSTKAVLVEKMYLSILENGGLGGGWNKEGRTIDEYMEQTAVENLSQIKIAAVYGIEEYDEETRKTALDYINQKYGGQIAELKRMMTAYSYNGEMYFLGLEVAHYIDGGWAILDIGVQVDGQTLKYEPYSGNESALIDSWAQGDRTLYEVDWELLLANTEWQSYKDQSWIRFGSGKTVEMCLENIGEIWEGVYSCTDDRLIFSFVLGGRLREIQATVKQVVNEKIPAEGYLVMDKRIVFPGYKFQIYWYSY